MSSASAGIKTAFLPRAVQGGETSVNSAEITGLDGITVVLLLCYSGIMEAWHHCGITIVLPGSVGSYCHAQFTQSSSSRGREGGKKHKVEGKNPLCCYLKSCFVQGTWVHSDIVSECSLGRVLSRAFSRVLSALWSVRSNISTVTKIQSCAVLDS